MANLASLKKDFTRLIENKNLAHGYLFFGENQIGGVDFSQQLINFLENGSWAVSTGLMDAMIISGGIDDVRAGISFLWRKPIKSSRRTLIIPEASELTVEAQNAILKTAEEAPANALIILIVKNHEALLPTLVSRFQKIFLGNISTNNQSSFYPAATQKLVKRFLRGDITNRRQIIKDVLDTEDKYQWYDLITGLVMELNQDKLQNWRLIKELLYRWTAMNQYNTNKRLQLEAALSESRI